MLHTGSSNFVAPPEKYRPERDLAAHARRWTRGWLALAVIVWSCAGSSRVWGQANNPYALQPLPANYDSLLVDANGGGIAGATFAGWAQQALISNGKPTVLNATFLFSECFGGGILDDLQSSLGNTVSWVGASASTPTGISVGYSDGKGPGPWTGALVGQLAMANQSGLTSVTNAAMMDPYGNKGTMQELSQIVANGMSNFNLNEATNGAKNEVVVLWGGTSQTQDDLNDLNAMYTTLTKLWQGQNYLIDVMYGANGNVPKGAAWTNGTTTVNGNTETVATLAATSNALQTLLTQTLAPGGNSALTTSTQFLFYATDHGSFDNRINGNSPVTVPGSATDNETITLTAAQLQSINDSQADPSLTIKYYGLSQDVGVYVNGYFLGDLISGGTQTNPFTVTFDDFAFVLQQSNTISILNDNDPNSFVIVSKDFESGADEELVSSVPEPSSLVLGSLGFVGMAALIRSRRSGRWCHRVAAL